MIARRRLACPLALALGFVVVFAGAQDIDRFLLSEVEFRALPAEAQEHYTAAAEALDHIDYQGAHSEMRRAAEVAPDSAAIQFKLYDLALRMARVTTSRRAEDYLIVALEALERVANNPSSSDADRGRAQRQMDYVTDRLENAATEEQTRREAGRAYIHAYTLEQDWHDVQRRFGEMTRAILTQGGIGNVVTRSEVVLVDATGRIFRADGTPYSDEDGLQLNQADLPTGVILETEPDESLFTGVETAGGIEDLLPGLSIDLGSGARDTGLESSTMPDDSDAASVEMPTSDVEDDMASDLDDSEETMEMADAEDETFEVGGSLSPAVFDDLEENAESAASSGNPFNF